MMSDEFMLAYLFSKFVNETENLPIYIRYWILFWNMSDLKLDFWTKSKIIFI